MVKIAQRKVNKTVHQVANDSSLAVYDDGVGSTPTSNVNSAVDRQNMTAGNDVNRGEYLQQSNVWKFATKVSSEQARCNICQIVLSRKGQSTSSVRRHLRLVHKIKEFEEKRSNQTKSNNSFNQLPIDHRRELQQLAINSIIEDGRSFNDLNKPGIQRLFNRLLNGFRAPHRNTVKRNIKRLSSIHVKKLTKQLVEANFIAVTANFWCDRSARSYLCMTGHWNKNDMIIMSKVLVFTPYFDRHTSENISSELEHHLKQLGIFEKTTTITCDGASNIKASFKRIDSRIKRVQCLAHKLHFIVCNTLGLWIKSPKENDGNESTGGNAVEESLDHDVRNLFLNELNGDSDVSVRDDQEENDKSSNHSEESEEEQEEEDVEESENNDYLSIDFWANDVNTDPDLANELQENIGSVLHKCRSTIKMIHKSSNLSMYMDNLKDAHGLDNSLSIDCKSRWNSTKHMIEILIKFKGLINQLHDDKHNLYLNNKSKQKLTNLELSSNEWVLLAAMEQVLRPFNEATKLMSGQKYPTIGTALFAIRKIKSFFESYVENNSFVNEMKELLVQQIIRYIDNDAEQLELIVFLAYFDPLGFSVLTQRERTTVEREIKQMLKDLNSEFESSNMNHGSQVDATQTSTSSSIDSSQGGPSKKKSAFSSFLSSVSIDPMKKRSTCSSTNKTSSVADELVLYKSLALNEVQKVVKMELNPDTNAFWRIYGNQLPELRFLAKRYLCTPATSVPSESAFSIASNLGRRQRARLDPSTLAMTVFLKDKVNDVEN